MDSVNTLVQQSVTYILVALGGGSVLTACTIKWGAKLLSDLLYKKIDQKYTMELEAYKQQLEKQTNKVNTLLNRILHISTSQFDKEFEIYIGVWEHLICCRQAYSSLMEAYTGEPPLNLNDHIKSIKEHYQSFSTAAKQYQNTVQKHAPFYSKEFYEAFTSLEQLFFYQVSVIGNYEEDPNLPEEKQDTLSQYEEEIEKQSQLVQEKMRNYLHSIKIIDVIS